jgi:hypothetical protein
VRCLRSTGRDENLAISGESGLEQICAGWRRSRIAKPRLANQQIAGGNPRITLVSAGSMQPAPEAMALEQDRISLNQADPWISL